MIKAIIFDMDGVIIDSEPLWDEMDKIFLKGYKVEREYLRWAKGRKESEVALFLKKKYNLAGSVAKIVKERAQIVHKLEVEKLKLMKGFLALIKKLKSKYRLALASSSSQKSIFWVVRRFKISNYFEILVSGQEVKKAKPNPEIFLKTAKKLGINPKECLVIEDAINGVASAKRAKMKCIALKQPYMRYKDLKRADVIVSSLREINLNLINKL